MHYSDRQLENLLRQDDGDLLASAAELQHLEDCPQCQQRLAQLSGDCWDHPESLEFFRDTLLSDTQVEGETNFWPPEDHASVSRSITISIGPSGDWEEESDRRQKEPRVNTSFLEPALYPDLLGRLGRYDVEHVIGAGGFGIVLKAHDSELRRVVALKVLAPHLMSSAAARQRFAREAQTAAAIVHEHVIPIYDVVNTDDQCYLVMQYIAGESLQERVDRQGPLPVEDVLRIASQIAAGLDAAHQQGVVHRDVKPANILMEKSVDRVLISDFGLARTADDANLTRSGVITGTPHYMSPEQASGALVDNRSDLFSLGSVMYFMCTGRPPFRAPQIVAVLNRICNHAHRPVQQIQPQIPAPVADLIDRLLSKDPARRFHSAAAARAAIGQMLADYQSGKLAADLRETERLRAWKAQVLGWARATGMTAAMSLLVWGGYQAWNGWSATPVQPEPQPRQFQLLFDYPDPVYEIYAWEQKWQQDVQQLEAALYQMQLLEQEQLNSIMAPAAPMAPQRPGVTEPAPDTPVSPALVTPEPGNGAGAGDTIDIPSLLMRNPGLPPVKQFSSSRQQSISIQSSFSAGGTSSSGSVSGGVSVGGTASGGSSSGGTFRSGTVRDSTRQKNEDPR